MALVHLSYPQVTVTLLLLLFMLSLAAGGKLLVVPVGGSHWLTMREVVDGLKQKGHEIVVVSPEFNLHVKPSENFTMKMYSVPVTEEEINGDFQAFLKDAFEEGSFLERFHRVRERVKRLFELGFIACEQLLYNKELMRYLEENNFDALFTDPALPCGAIVAEHLSIPSVYLLRGIPCGLDIEATQCPSPPSYVPRLFTDHTDHMNFLQRVKNVIFDTSNLFLCDFLFKPYEKLASEFLQRDVTMLDLFRKASVWLLRLLSVEEEFFALLVNVCGGTLHPLVKGTARYCVLPVVFSLCSTPHILAGMALVLPSHTQVTVTLLLLLSMLSLAACGKLLVVPIDGSHWLSMREVLDGLRQKGHEIVVVAPEVNLHIKPSENFILKTYPVPFTQEEMDGTFRQFSQDAFSEGSFLERLSRIHQRAEKMSTIFLSTCERLLYNKELIRYLEESEFDALFTDPALPCGAIVAEHLSIPSVFLLQQIPCGLDIDATQCPNPPSYVPRIFSGNTDHMNFLQRVKNIFFDIPHSLLCHLLFQPYTKLASEFLQQDVTVLDLLRKASIWLLRFDFVFHYPKPLMPNMIIIGGITCTHKKLSQVGDAFIFFFT
ncbi:uncharacterized protein LOC110400571 [Numida meleagris]|uniref:uncharacterized protein LOC110400571 n=1 Tax=Numida meleagris TaxID=8996 RepID=UPI000B3DB4A7|nr:uncharacterized protein LOC110400571 [Numida meleagris]